jgi:excisionase family DNA binding protein
MEPFSQIIEQLTIIRQELDELKTAKKEILSFQEACKYLQLGHSHLYKMTSKREIPCYQPSGKKLYFKRAELDEWLLQNRKCTTDEISLKASNYILSNPKRKGGVR